MQHAPFQAKISLCNPQHAIEIVDKHILTFIKYNQHLDKEMDSDAGDDEAEAEVTELQQRAESGLVALCSLFCAHPEFRDRDAAEQYLRDVTSLNDPRALQCRAWISNIMTELVDEVEGGSIIFEAGEASVLRNRVQPFIADTSDAMIPGTALQCCPWPIVDSIHLGVMSRVLKPGVRLVDNPGRNAVYARG
jgi:hypothetical protein